MLETAMLKVFTTERLWDAVNDAFQIHGGSAYLDDLPLERMLRDARINQIGEGSNEVLTSFIALVGMRGPGMEFKEIYDTMLKPSRGIGKAWAAGLNRLGAAFEVRTCRCKANSCARQARQLGTIGLAFQFRGQSGAHRSIASRSWKCSWSRNGSRTRRWNCLPTTCVLSRIDSEIQLVREMATPSPDHPDAQSFLRQSFRRIRGFLAGLTDNDDKAVIKAAQSCLTSDPARAV